MLMMFRTVLLAAVVPLAVCSEYSYTYDYTDAPTASPTFTDAPTTTEAPTRTETYAPTRMTQAPSKRLRRVASVCVRDRRQAEFANTERIRHALTARCCMLYSPTTLLTLERSIPLQRLGHVSLVVAGHAELRAVRDLHRANER